MPRLTVESPLGPLVVTEEDGAIVSIRWLEEDNVEGGTDETPVLQDARRQLDEYFAGERSVFDLPIAPEGTEFEKKVWDELLAIPYGESKLYGDVARALGGIARAVGGACGSNPIPIVIPCHRVVGQNGLTGFSGGKGVDTKKALLDLERGQKSLF
jgi:methylated-DNA-[protein]-cysteine S-methyltransferase